MDALHGPPVFHPATFHCTVPRQPDPAITVYRFEREGSAVVQ